MAHCTLTEINLSFQSLPVESFTCCHLETNLVKRRKTISLTLPAAKIDGTVSRVRRDLVSAHMAVSIFATR